MDEYEVASEEILTHLARLPGIVAVYRTGSVSVAGISDLDFIAVVKGESNLPIFWDRLSPRSRYLAMHSPAVADVETFVKHRWFSSAEPLELFWGDAVAVEQRPSRPLADLLLAAEGLMNGFLRLMKQAETRRIKVRPALCEFNAMRYSLKAAGLDRDDCLEPWRFVDDVQALRREWFSSQSTGLEPVLDRSVGATTEAIRALVERTREQAVLAEEVHRRAAFLRLDKPWGNVLLIANPDEPGPEAYGPSWSILLSPARHSRRGAELAWRTARWRVEVPPSFLGLLMGNVSSEHREFLHDRGVIVRRYRAFISSRAPSYGMLGTASSFVGP